MLTLIRLFLRSLLKLLRDDRGELPVPEFIAKWKPSKTTPPLRIESVPDNFTLTKKQIDTLARQMMPDIKAFFADEQVQREFAEWQAKQAATQ
jgi:hypothetical protein